MRALIVARLLVMAALAWSPSRAQAGQAGPTGDSDDRSLQYLLGLATHREPEARLRAITSLGGTPQIEPAVKRAVALALFEALDDPERSVRVAALLSLVNMGGWDYDPGHAQRIARVSPELAAWAAEHQTDPAIQRSLGVAYLLTGEPNLAARALEISLGLDPNGESTRYLLGLARMRQQRASDASALFRQVPASDPYYPNAQEQLKQLP
jgi:tetratricopeptide (TPR) repeat protein